MQRSLPGIARGGWRRPSNAVDRQKTVVPIDSAILDVGLEDADIGDIKREIEASRHVRQPLLRLLALGDVGIGADEAGRGAIFVPFDTSTTAFDPDPVAVPVALAIHENLIVR